ncbi:lipocalin-like domain-containing protein [Cupriavidus alkaliphilus]|uniref:lipocalin-like domain-containing protein n=1 Tax=Cupriavidus alkaliphilus TaxID=942866 RepID=UPI001616416E
MNPLEGIWRLVDSRAWDEHDRQLASPYGTNPIGHIAFVNGRMLAALCNGDASATGNETRGYSSYGGPYSFDGETLVVDVDMASDLSRIGGRQIRGVRVIADNRIVLLPPARNYGNSPQRRELLWERVWQPDTEGVRPLPESADW